MIFALTWKSTKNKKKREKNNSKSIFVLTCVFQGFWSQLGWILGPKLGSNKFIAPRLFPNSVQVTSKYRLRGSKSAPRVSKRRPRASQERPKSVPRASKSVPRAAKSGQDSPKRVPRGSPEGPERRQEGSEVRRKNHSSETSKK